MAWINQQGDLFSLKGGTLMKMRKPGLILLLCISFLITLVSSASGGPPPPLPSSFYGTVMVSGMSVPVGTPVGAWIDGVPYAETATVLHNGGIVYALSVSGDDPSTPLREGGAEGNVIQFRIGNLIAEQTGTWRSGGNEGINLSAIGYILAVTSEHGVVSREPELYFYQQGDEVSLAAQANACWEFVSWSGGVSGSENPVALTIVGHTEVTAEYDWVGCGYQVFLPLIRK